MVLRLVLGRFVLPGIDKFDAEIKKVAAITRSKRCSMGLGNCSNLRIELAHWSAMPAAFGDDFSIKISRIPVET